MVSQPGHGPIPSCSAGGIAIDLGLVTMLCQKAAIHTVLDQLHKIDHASQQL